MSGVIFITRDFEQMSDASAEWIEGELSKLSGEKEETVLGLATGSSPTGLYRRLADSANRGRLDSRRWRTFNLDEYIGLPGDTPEARIQHPESYHRFMEEAFFDLLQNKPLERNVPPGHRLEVEELRRALKESPGDWREEGSLRGHAILFREEVESDFLAGLRAQVLEPYAARIEMAGGIDLQVIGVGGAGHVAFHEAGIPFDLTGLILVRLDRVTREHAVEDGHFNSLEESPEYALTMSVDLVFQARRVLVLASGNRKREAIRRSLLDEPGCELPLSYGQIYRNRGGEIVYVLDAEAAADLMGRERELADRGFEVKDLRMS